MALGLVLLTRGDDDDGMNYSTDIHPRQDNVTYRQEQERDQVDPIDYDEMIQRALKAEVQS